VMVWACRWHTDWEVLGDQITLRQTSTHATTGWCGCLEGRCKRAKPKECWDGVD
jgi:hypothetical protein